MSKESYIRGFCKAAEAAGVDPQALAKYADAMLENDKGRFVVPQSPDGTTDWLAPTNRLTMVTLGNNGGRYEIPGGPASLTNSPSAVIEKITPGKEKGNPWYKDTLRAVGLGDPSWDAKRVPVDKVEHIPLWQKTLSEGNKPTLRPTDAARQILQRMAGNQNFRIVPPVGSAKK